MAIVRSHTVWGSRKSAGGVTYRQDRGRTIMSQKRGPQPKTRGDLVLLYREGLFGVINAAARVMAESIEISFDKTKYGSRRNNFFKKNYRYFEQLVQAPIAASGGKFVEVLNGFGLETGQTIISGLQQGVIDISAVEVAMRESYDGSKYNFMAFATWSQNVNAAIAYVRADIGETYIVAEATDAWNVNENPIEEIRISSMIAATTGTEDGMKVTSFTFTGSNLQKLQEESYIIYDNKGANVSGEWINGGQKFNVTDQGAASQIPAGTTKTFFLNKRVDGGLGKVIAKTDVYGSNGAVGE